MPRSQAHLENNTFVKGLITEASPLTFPENASIDEENFVLHTDGTRDRRLGVDYETNYNIVTSNQQIPTNRSTVFNTYNWQGVAGDSSLDVAVVQIGNRISFFNTVEGAVSTNQIGSDFEVGAGTAPYGFAAVDGLLVVASNEATITVFTYDAGAITESQETLVVRDLFGVEDVVDGNDLFSQEHISLTPETLTDAHLYNLHNQTWGVPRTSASRSTKWWPGSPDLLTNGRDSIVAFFNDTGRYPSNAHNIHAAIYASSTATPPEFKFYADEFVRQPPANSEAAKGFFLIDVLNRGTSRVNQFAANIAKYPTGELELTLSDLPLDRTCNGAKTLAEFSGRVFYAGFDGEVISGDSRSPNLSSYVLFSKLVSNSAEIGQCYQEGDPTDKESPELIATDGGFIKIQGAVGIKRLVNIGSVLVVLADNGAWLIKGEEGIGFSATQYEVVRLSDRGCVSANSAVVIDNTVAYWSEDGIYLLSPDEFGKFSAKNLSHGTIKKLYDSISIEDKEQTHGVYDTFQRKVMWTYGGRLGSTGSVEQLILDVSLQAFSKNTFQTASGTLYPRMVGAIEVPPFTSSISIDDVVVGGDQVQASGVDVQVTVTTRDAAIREVKYLTITGENASGNPLYTFSNLKDTDFLDWKTYDGTGQDAAAYLLTGYLTGGDSSRKKYVPNIYFNFKRTEDGFQVVDGDTVPTNPSSCKVQAQWDWANSANSGKFGREFQAYRYKRHYIPTDLSDTYDYGFETIVTRNRLRGNGKALSLLIKSEPAKDLRLLGWGQEVLVNRRA